MLQEYFYDEGIIDKPTTSYSRESYGKAKRLNRNIIERSRAIMAELKAINPDLDQSVRYLCTEAVHRCSYVRN